MSVAIPILHSAGGVVSRYEQELWGVRAPEEEGAELGAPAGGGQRDPLNPLEIGPDTSAIEAQHHREERAEDEKVRNEERAREEGIRAREEGIRKEEKQERESVRSEERNERQQERSQPTPPPEIVIEVNEAAQPAKAAPVRQSSSRTSGGTGRK